MASNNRTAALGNLFLLAFSSLLLSVAPPVPATVLADEILPPEEVRYTGPCMGEAAFEDTWLDRTHSYLTSILCQPSVWFDGFFGTPRAKEEWAGSLVRWEGSVRFDERTDPEYRSAISADLRLPRMTRRLKLVFQSETREDQSEDLPDDDPYNLGPPDTGVGEESQATAGLRYYLIDTRRARMNLGGGLKFGDPVQPYLRLRLRYTEPLGSSTLLRLTPSVIWLREEGINRSARIDLEQRLSENLLLRISQSFLRKELVPGTEWGSVVTLYDRLSPVTVLAFIAGAKGVTYPDNRVVRYRLATRLRSNFLRDWLFLELEPEYYWPRDDLGRYHLYRAITFRMQLQFYS